MENVHFRKRKMIIRLFLVIDVGESCKQEKKEALSLEFLYSSFRAVNMCSF